MRPCVCTAGHTTTSVACCGWGCNDSSRASDCSLRAPMRLRDAHEWGTGPHYTTLHNTYGNPPPTYGNGNPPPREQLGSAPPGMPPPCPLLPNRLRSLTEIYVPAGSPKAKGRPSSSAIAKPTLEALLSQTPLGVHWGPNGAPPFTFGTTVVGGSHLLTDRLGALFLSFVVPHLPTYHCSFPAPFICSAEGGTCQEDEADSCGPRAERGTGREQRQEESGTELMQLSTPFCSVQCCCSVWGQLMLSCCRCACTPTIAYGLPQVEGWWRRW